MKLARTTLESLKVERPHSWLNRFRGLLIRGPKKVQNPLALLHLACCGTITWRMIDLLG